VGHINVGSRTRFLPERRLNHSGGAPLLTLFEKWLAKLLALWDSGLRGRRWDPYLTHVHLGTRGVKNKAHCAIGLAPTHSQKTRMNGAPRRWLCRQVKSRPPVRTLFHPIIVSGWIRL